MVGEDIPHDMIEELEEADLLEIFEISLKSLNSE
jgi:hypothetical protein